MILALDIGGTKLSSAFWDGSSLLERTEIPTPTDRTPENLLSACLELIAPKLPLSRAIRVAACGSVAGGVVTALNNETLHHWQNGVNVAAWLEKHTNLETKVLNDADAAAWGEFKRGAGRGTRDFAFVTVSTGIGGGLIINQELHLTPHGLHAELGFTLTDADIPLEYIASGSALNKIAIKHGWADTKELLARANAGDKTADVLLEDSAARVARLLANLRAILGTDKAAIGGGLGLAPTYLERVQKHLQRFGSPWASLEVTRAELGADAGLVGAAVY
ncbi:MAG: N-acetylmannosamine kinase [Deinococcota bacterium]|jgi:N-acylmannosamine kinase